MLWVMIQNYQGKMYEAIKAKGLTFSVNRSEVGASL